MNKWFNSKLNFEWYIGRGAPYGLSLGRHKDFVIVVTGYKNVRPVLDVVSNFTDPETEAEEDKNERMTKDNLSFTCDKNEHQCSTSPYDDRTLSTSLPKTSPRLEISFWHFVRFHVKFWKRKNWFYNYLIFIFIFAFVLREIAQNVTFDYLYKTWLKILLVNGVKLIRWFLQNFKMIPFFFLFQMYLVQITMWLPPKLWTGTWKWWIRMRIFSSNRWRLSRTFVLLVRLHYVPLDHSLLGHRVDPGLGDHAPAQMAQSTTHTPRSS